MAAAKFIVNMTIKNSTDFDVPTLIILPFKLFKGKLATTVFEHNEMVTTTRLEF